MNALHVTGIALAISASIAAGTSAQQVAGLNPRELFEQLDSNSDRVVAAEEVPDAGRAAFKKLLAVGDKNHDGKLEAEEFRALIAKAAGAFGRAGMPRERFAALDKNGDGKVSKDEFAGPPARFAQLDADHDGFVTRQEAGGPGMPPGGPGALPPRLKAMDKNNDGKVSRDEFTGPAPRFDRIDADGDGYLTLQEVRQFAARAAAASPGQGAFARFDAIDKNKDGKISREEFPGPAKRFDRLDADHDGSLTRAELHAAASTRPAPK